MPCVREGTHAAVRRVFFDGVVYHVFNQLARGERVFAKSDPAARFVELLKEFGANLVPGLKKLGSGVGVGE